MDSEHVLPACNTEPTTTLSEPIAHPPNPRECKEYQRYKLIEKITPEEHMPRLLPSNTCHAQDHQLLITY
jgi:hypothetical protein